MMKDMYLATFLTLVVVAAVPNLASATGVCDPLGLACAGTDTVSSDGPCPLSGQSHSGKDVVVVYGDQFFAYAVGASGNDCSGNHYNFVQAAACTGAGCAMAHWGTADDDECHTGVFAADEWVGTGCPVSPPDPGWGTLLP